VFVTKKLSLHEVQIRQLVNVAVCSESHTEFIITLCGSVLLDVKSYCSHSDIGYTEYILGFTDYEQSQGSSVNIMSDYGLDDREIGVLSPIKANYFSPNLCVSAFHTASCTMGSVCPLSWAKARPGRDADHSPLSSAEFKN
jgi:hypothetical protein